MIRSNLRTGIFSLTSTGANYVKQVSGWDFYLISIFSESQFIVNGVAGCFMRMIRVYFAMVNMVTETRRRDRFCPFTQCFGVHCLPGVLKYPSAIQVV